MLGTKLGFVTVCWPAANSGNLEQALSVVAASNFSRCYTLSPTGLQLACALLLQTHVATCSTVLPVIIEAQPGLKSDFTQLWVQNGPSLGVKYQKLALVEILSLPYSSLLVVS